MMALKEEINNEANINEANTNEANTNEASANETTNTLDELIQGKSNSKNNLSCSL